MSLEKWLEKSGCYCQDVNASCKLVFLGRVMGTSKCQVRIEAERTAGLWQLADYAVSSVSGERVYLVARKAG